MSDNAVEWPYWSVDIPGLSQTEAQKVLTMAAQAGIGIGGSLVDPALFLTLILDRDTVVSFTRIFDLIHLSLGPESKEDKMIVASIIEVMNEWLDASGKPE